MTMTLKQINSAIVGIKTSTANLNAKIQDVAVACIEHTLALNDQGQPFADANPAMRLVVAVAPRFRKPLIDWFATYSRINIGKKGDAYTCSMSKKEDRTDNVEAAKLNAWYDAQGAGDGDVLPLTAEDLDTTIINLAKRLQKKLDDGKVLESDRAAFVEKIAAIKGLSQAA